MSDERKIVGYDMMTGEPIYEETAPVAETVVPAEPVVEEPIATEPVAAEPVPAPPVVAEEPVTEAPVSAGANQEFLGYDQMTGQPIYGQPQQAAQPTGFDPMTGQPIYGQPQQTAQPTGFDPMTGQPIYGQPQQAAPAPQEKKKGKVPVIILSVIAGVVVLALLAVVGVKSGLFLSKGNKVAIATANTLSETPQLIKDLSPIMAVTSGTFAVTGNFEMDDVAVEGTVSVDKTEVSAHGYASIDDFPEIDFAAEVTPKGIKAQSKAISDLVFIYNTADDKEDSFIAEMAGEDTLEMLDDALTALGEATEPTDFSKDLTQLIVAEYGELEFEKAKEKEFEVNGKDVKCKGYTVEVTEDNIMNIVDGMEDILDETYGDILKEAGISAKDITREIEYEIEGMDDIELTFYLYKSKLAAVIAEVDRSKLEIEFQGGDYRMQNVVVSADRRDIMEIKGETEDSVETLELLVWDEEVFTYEYDTKSGDLVVELDEGFYEVEANIQAKGNSVTVTLQDFYTEDSYVGEMMNLADINCSVTFTDGAKKASFSGEEFNVGTADEDDFYDLIEELEDTLEDFEELYYYF